MEPGFLEGMSALFDCQCGHYGIRGLSPQSPLLKTTTLFSFSFSFSLFLLCVCFASDVTPIHRLKNKSLKWIGKVNAPLDLTQRGEYPYFAHNGTFIIIKVSRLKVKVFTAVKSDTHFGLNLSKALLGLGKIARPWHWVPPITESWMQINLWRLDKT